MPQQFTIEDAPKFTIGDDSKEEVLARAAQPTQFEKAAAPDTHPIAGMLRGFGEGALQDVADIGSGIHAIPYVGPKIIPSEGLAAEKSIATPMNQNEKAGSQIENIAEMGIPIGEGLKAVGESKYVRPAAQYLSENGIPMLKTLPFGIGRGIQAAENAPSFVKAATRGAVGGAGLGALEQAVRTRDPYETAKGALYGGVGGATLGMAAHGINRLATLPKVAEELEEAPTTTNAQGLQRVQGLYDLLEPSIPQNVRRLPGEVAPERVGAAERLPAIPMRPPTVELPGGGVLTSERPLLTSGTPVQPRAELPAMQPAKATAAPQGNALGRLQGLIEEAAGVKPLQPNVPLRNQLSVGAASEGFPAVGEVPQNLGGKVTFRREPIVKTLPGLEEGPLRAKAPEELPTVVPEETARQMGAPPTQMNVPFRQQLKVTGMEPASKQLTLEQKYPDRELRQLVHANGEEMVEATKNDRETLKAIHDLKNPDVRQAAINGGIKMVREDGSPIMVNNRKASGDISRQEIFKQLLAKGQTPQQILDLAKEEAEEGTRKPGPSRVVNKAKEEKAGD